MRPVHHVIISAGVGALVAYGFKSWTAGIACLLGGVLIDLDHHLDFIIIKKKIPFWKDLNTFCDFDRSWKLYLFFHSYELFLLLWIFLFYFKLGAVWFGLAIGMTIHMICDQIVNPVKPLTYFFLYRLAHKFNQGDLLTDRHFKHEK